MMIFTFLKTENHELKNFIGTEFIDKIDADDIEYHLSKDSFYENLKHIITSEEDMKMLDEYI